MILNQRAVEISAGRACNEAAWVAVVVQLAFIDVMSASVRVPKDVTKGKREHDQVIQVRNEEQPRSSYRVRVDRGADVDDPLTPMAGLRMKSIGHSRGARQRDDEC